MQTVINQYLNHINDYLKSQDFIDNFKKLLEAIRLHSRIVILGSGGSHAIASHICEDFVTMANKKAITLDSPTYLTALSNDYGYESALSKWLAYIDLCTDDLLILMSCSGNSKALIAASAHSHSGNRIILTSFDKTNKLNSMRAAAKFYIPTNLYGISQCIHEIILHMAVDHFIKEKK